MLGIKNIFRTALFISCMVSISACIDDDEEDFGVDSGSTGSDTQSSAGGSCSGYTDIVSSSEKERSNACGIQVSSFFLQGDTYLSAAIAACQQGNTAAADEYYSNYQTTIEVGRETMNSICSGGGGNSGSGGDSGSRGGTGIEDTSPQTYYNLCVTSYPENGRIRYFAGCWGPVQQYEGGCGRDDLSYLRNYSSESSCISSRDQWLDDQVN